MIELMKKGVNILKMNKVMQWHFSPAHQLVDLLKYCACSLYIRKSYNWKRHSLDSVSLATDLNVCHRAVNCVIHYVFSCVF
jgi:hypothetical protein